MTDSRVELVAKVLSDSGIGSRKPTNADYALAEEIIRALDRAQVQADRSAT